MNVRSKGSCSYALQKPVRGVMCYDRNITSITMSVNPAIIIFISNTNWLLCELSIFVNPG